MVVTGSSLTETTRWNKDTVTWTDYTSGTTNWKQFHAWKNYHDKGSEVEVYQARIRSYYTLVVMDRLINTG